MENKQILRADYLDILFDNRNKNYGSYVLRKGYDRRAFTAIGIVIGLIVLAFAMKLIVNYYLPGTTPIAANQSDHLTEVNFSTELLIPETKPDMLKPETIIPEKAAPPPVAVTVQFTEPKIVPPDLVKPGDAPPAIDDIADKLVGPVNNEGQAGGNAIALSKDISKVAGDGEDARLCNKTASSPPVTTAAIKNPDEWPEYPGGKKALQEYLSRNIKYPAAAAEVGLEGQVVVSFVVNEQGEIADVKIVKQLGGGCDQESLRVVKAMPKWKPGRKNGQAVKVYYLLPVSFKLRN